MLLASIDQEAAISEVRLERSPIKMFGLGMLGFDHLDIVYIPSADAMAEQERWFVIEGVRDFDASSGRSLLGVVGWDGATTLSDANGGRTGLDLSHSIGSAEARGGTPVAIGADAIKTWSLIVAASGDIARSQYPYIAYAPAASPLPTLNSSSLVSSVLFHAGLDYEAHLPAGLRFSPGLSTLLASSGDDRLRLPQSFDAVLGGAGDDVLAGRQDAARSDKLYGGRGNDTLVWSEGRNILNGGEPGLPYAGDGLDRISYAGAGPVEIVGHADAREHVIPDFTATRAGGSDDLFSIEELIWDDQNDHITVGPGAGLIRSSLKISSYGGDDWIDASLTETQLDVESGNGNDVIIAGRQPLELSAGRGHDLLVLGSEAADVTIADAERGDRLLVPWPVQDAMLWRDETGFGAVLDIRGNGGAARVHIRQFVPGTLGICVEPPDRVPPEMLRAGNGETDCGGDAHLVHDLGDDPGFDAGLPGTADDPSSGHF